MCSCLELGTEKSFGFVEQTYSTAQIKASIISIFEYIFLKLISIQGTHSL